MFLVSSYSCLYPFHWSQVLSRAWRCSWSSADRRCSSYIWVINKFIAYKDATYIRGLTALLHALYSMLIQLIKDAPAILNFDLCTVFYMIFINSVFPPATRHNQLCWQENSRLPPCRPWSPCSHRTQQKAWGGKHLPRGSSASQREAW